MAKLDCLIVASNIIPFQDSERSSRSKGADNPFSKEITSSYIQYHNQNYCIDDLINAIFKESAESPIATSDIFSATVSYLVSYLEKNGLDCDYVLSFRDEKERIRKIFKEYEVLSVAISTTYYLTSFHVLEIIRFIRKCSKSTKIIVGGPLIYQMVYKLKKNTKAINRFLKEVYADYYVINSQGEQALTNLVRIIQEQGSVEDIPNIAYRSGSDYIVNHLFHENNEINDNFTNWSLFSNRLSGVASIRTSISCANRCSFCSFPQMQGKYQELSVEGIKTELDQLANTRKIERLFFIDDTLNVPLSRFESFLDIMLSVPKQFRWNSFLRCQNLNEAIVEKMYNSGCESVFLGIESGCQYILDKMNKKAKIEDMKRGIALLKAAGITTFGSFICGFPGETEESFSQTVRFIRECGLDFFRIQTWYYDKNTPIANQELEFNIIGEQYCWKHATMDSVSASGLVQKAFHDITESIWLPERNMDYSLIFLLFQKMIPLEDIKTVFSIFHDEVCQKLNSAEQRQMSTESYNKIRNLLV